MVDQILVGTIAVLRERYRSSVPLRLFATAVPSND
jgi:hypothetical protein